MTEPFVDDRGMNGTVFLAYLEQVLVPTLKSGDTVNMDNLPPTSQRASVRRSNAQAQRCSSFRRTAQT